MSKPDLVSHYNFLDAEILKILNDIKRAIVDIYDILIDVNFHDNYTSNINSTGQNQTNLDLIAHDIFIKSLNSNSELAYIISEESEKPISLNPEGKYVVAIDPIDGSSNPSINCTSGSIFTIFPFIKSDNEYGFILPKGSDHIISGFSLFGIKCQLLIADNTKKSIQELVWDRKKQVFIPNSEKLSFPSNPHYYSINEGYSSEFNSETLRRVEVLKSYKLSHRLGGCLISDVYRLLKKGGLLLYPEMKNSPEGKIRLLYESIPVAMIAEYAGGAASNGKENILDINPTSIHQKSPLYTGNKELIEELF